MIEIRYGVYIKLKGKPGFLSQHLVRTEEGARKIDICPGDVGFDFREEQLEFLKVVEVELSYIEPEVEG